MILFWLICAAFVAIALAFVLPPLLPGFRKETHTDNKEANIEIYRDQLAELGADLKNGIVSEDQYKLDRDEIERRMLDDVSGLGKVAGKQSQSVANNRGPVYAIAILMPAVALAFYLRVGNPAALSASSRVLTQPGASGNSRPSGPMSSQDIAANVASLAKRMEQNPGDAAGWEMLGRSYVSLENYKDAADAYSKAAALKPNDAETLADYAYALGMANNRTLSGQPTDLIKKALALDPNNAKALELAGSAAFEASKYQEAIDYWQRLLQRTPKNSELASALSERIEEAKSAAASKK